MPARILDPKIDGGSGEVCVVVISNVGIVGVSGSTISTGVYATAGSGGTLNLYPSNVATLNMHTPSNYGSGVVVAQPA